MSGTRTGLVLLLLFLSGCGGCQHNEEPPAAGGGAAVSTAPARAPAASGAKIQAGGVQPTIVQRAPAAPPAERAMPPAGASPGANEPESATEPGAGEEGDCIVVADANPDYGPPPLSVAFTAEAECSAGQPAYKWEFGDGSPGSTEANPSHTYAQAGEYTASVSVTGPGGATASDEIDITVEAGDAEPPQ